jgi:TonB family protein
MAFGLVVLAAAPAAAQNNLATARELYAAAAYEEALNLLNLLQQREQGADEQQAIQQYRAFCLLALGRTADAEQAIEAVVSARPSYHPSETDLSPRIRSTFADVRRRVLPTVVQQQYAIAKAAYDRKDYKEAADRFTQVLKLLDDPDVAPSSLRPPLSDVRTLSTGFRDLAIAAAAPPPPPPPAPEPVPSPVPAASAEPRIYTVADRRVVPPIVIRQWLPSFPSSINVPQQAQGVIEVVINEQGRVEHALMRQPLNPTYDRQALAAARSWQYQPATVDGAPVKFRKTVLVNIQR